MTKTHDIFDVPPDGFAMAPANPGEVLQEEYPLRAASQRVPWASNCACRQTT